MSANGRSLPARLSREGRVAEKPGAFPKGSSFEKRQRSKNLFIPGQSRSFPKRLRVFKATAR